jgi:hypothetical protein
MLRRLGANGRMGQDWFTKYTLAEALHIRAEEVQEWIDRGWLQVPNRANRETQEGDHRRGRFL